MLFWCCCNCNTTVVQTVRGCSSALLSGVTVNIKVGGVTIATGTTNGSGVATIVASSAINASATVEIVGPTGYQTNTGTITLNCGTVTRSTTLAVATGYSCSPDSCCPQGGSAPYPVIAYPSTITLNDGIADVTLSRIGGTSSSQYRGYADRTAAQGYSCSTSPTGAPWPLNSSVTVRVYFEVNCNTLSIWCNDCVASSGGGCDQEPTLTFLYNNGLGLTAYPSTLTDDTSSCYHGYGSNVSSNGAAFFGNQGTGSVSACPPSFAGSATVSFKQGANRYYAPWQVYGNSVTCTWTQ